MDDTAGKIQAQLKSDHQSSSLSLGYLTRIDDNTGRLDERGEGFELRSDGHGVVRAQDGLLITTERRSNAATHAKAMAETSERLNLAHAQHDEHAEAAQTDRAQTKPGDQHDVQQAIHTQNRDIAGTAATPSNADPQSFPELGAPHLVLASQAGVVASTAANLHLHAGQHIAITSESHASFSIAKRWLASAAAGIRAFAHHGGIKAIASEGDIDIQAQSDEIVLLAHKDVRFVSINGEIHVTAKKKVVVIGGGSYTEWSAEGITHGTAGSWQEHAAMHLQEGPMQKAVEMPQFARGEFTSKNKFSPSA